MRNVLLILIVIYQKAISPLLPARCRYYPTCSAYARTALTTHSLPKALRLIVRRLMRCQPFGGSGLDLVPLPLYRFVFRPSNVIRCVVLKDRMDYRSYQYHFMA